MGATNFQCDEWINELRGMTLYVGMFTVATDDTGAGTEASDVDYDRQLITLSDPVGGRITSNVGDLVFPALATSQGRVTHAAVFDAVTAGNMRLQGPVTPVNWVAGMELQFDEGTLVFELN